MPWDRQPTGPIQGTPDLVTAARAQHPPALIEEKPLHLPVFHFLCHATRLVPHCLICQGGTSRLERITGCVRPVESAAKYSVVWGRFVLDLDRSAGVISFAMLSLAAALPVAAIVLLIATLEAGYFDVVGLAMAWLATIW